jgi:hypothetical protein
LNRAEENVEEFLMRHAARQLSPDDKVAVLKLMEIQRHAMLMYTSCGWFFDELSGIETVQVIQYAARAIQLASDVLGIDLEAGFLERLEEAKSNIAEAGDGRRIYEQYVKPAMITWENVVAHYAISSVFTAYEERTRIFLYGFEEQHRKLLTSGKARLAFGTTRVTFEITRESKMYAYAVLYLGEHHLTAAVRAFLDENEYNEMARELRESFDRAEFAETIRLIDRHFGPQNYSLRSLFKDEQRRILDEILSTTRQDLEQRNRLVAERYTPLIRFLEDIGTPLPEALKSAVDFILHVDLINEFEAETTDVEHVDRLVEEARRRKVNVWDDTLNWAISNKMDRLVGKVEEDPGDVALAEQSARLAGVIRKLPLDPHLWRVRNRYWRMLKTVLPDLREKAAKGDAQAADWVRHFLALGDQLNFARHLLQPAV